MLFSSFAENDMKIILKKAAKNREPSDAKRSQTTADSSISSNENHIDARNPRDAMIRAEQDAHPSPHLIFDSYRAGVQLCLDRIIKSTVSVGSPVPVKLRPRVCSRISNAIVFEVVLPS